MTAVWIFLLSLLPLLIMVPAVFGYRWWMDRQPRRDPLTTDLRRLPGNSLQERRDTEREKVMTLMIWALASGFITGITVIGRHLPQNGFNWQHTDTIYLLIGLGASTILTWRMVRYMPALQRMKEGVRAEQAAAQELGEALAGRNRIIHDVQAGAFNIDHVVIDPRSHRRRTRGAHFPGRPGPVVGRHRSGPRQHPRLGTQVFVDAHRHPACPRRPQGLEPRALGRRPADSARPGRLAALCPVGRTLQPG